METTRRNFLKRSGQLAAVAAVSPQIVFGKIGDFGEHKALQEFHVKPPARTAGRWAVGCIRIECRPDRMAWMVHFTMTHLPTETCYEWTTLEDLAHSKKEILARCKPHIRAAVSRIMKKHGDFYISQLPSEEGL